MSSDATGTSVRCPHCEGTGNTRVDNHGTYADCAWCGGRGYVADASSNRVDDQHRKCQRCGLVHPCPDYAADAIPNSAHEHEWEAIGQIDRRCKRCGKVESGLEASQDWPHVGHQTRHRVAEFITYRPCGCPGAATTPHDPQVCQIQGHATRNRVPTLDQIVRALRDKDCPYLGNYKPGYDAALDDVLDEVRRAT